MCYKKVENIFLKDKIDEYLRILKSFESKATPCSLYACGATFTVLGGIFSEITLKSSRINHIKFQLQASAM